MYSSYYGILIIKCIYILSEGRNAFQICSIVPTWLMPGESTIIAKKPSKQRNIDWVISHQANQRSIITCRKYYNVWKFLSKKYFMSTSNDNEHFGCRRNSSHLPLGLKRIQKGITYLYCIWSRFVKGSHHVGNGDMMESI